MELFPLTPPIQRSTLLLTRLSKSIMPNVGRPSGACHTCRRMKVKCGEEKPQCNRCVRANRRCPGYGPKREMFRHSSIVSQGKPICQAASFQDIGEMLDMKVVEAKRQEEREQSPRTMNQEQDLQRRWSPVFNLSITTNWEQEAPKLFFHFYTIAAESDNVYGGHMSLLEDYCYSHSHIPYLVDALRAVALIDTSHRTSLQRLSEKAMSYRAKALCSLQQALCDKAEAKKDHVLLALFLLERFEVRPLLFPSDTNQHVHRLASQRREPVFKSLVQPFRRNVCYASSAWPVAI